jgi:hypothetical protein
MDEIASGKDPSHHEGIASGEAPLEMTAFHETKKSLKIALQAFLF